MFFKSEKRAAKERLSQQIIFLKKLVTIFENSFSSMGSPNPQL